MKLTLTLLALPLAAMASPFILAERSSKPNNIALIRGNLTAITDEIKKLNHTLNKAGRPNVTHDFDLGGLVEGANGILTGLQNITDLANVSQHATHSQSNHVYRYLNQTTYMNTVSLLDNFVRYYFSLKEGAIDNVVLLYFQWIQNATDAVGVALPKIASVHIKYKAPKLIADFDAAFAKAINYFETQINSTSSS